MLFLLFFCFSLSQESAPTQDLDLSAFKNMETWPLYGAGDLTLKPLNPDDLRIRFKARFPDGPLSTGQYVDTTMIMDLNHVFFQGRPAFWIQWTSTSHPEKRQNGAPAMDCLVVDAATHGVISRFAGSPGDRAWMGAHNLVQFQEGKVVQVSIAENGETQLKTLETQTRFLDFATLQFLLPRMELKAGLGFRIKGFQYQGSVETSPAVLVVGKINRADVHGVQREVWQVDVTNPQRSILCRFFIGEQAPYFYGWHYRLAKKGTLVTQMNYQTHYATSGEGTIVPR